MTLVVASLAGTTLGRYKLVEKLGSGGMATVYRAEDPMLGRQVAVKVMHPFIAERSEAGSRFEREAKAVAGLRHPNVMALHDYAPASAEHPAYLVMELLTGPSLQRFIVEHGAPLAEVAAMLGLRIAQALGAAHARGVVHRDVKPENVMFDLTGIPLGTDSREAPGLAPLGSPSARVVLCDFGIARVAAADGVTATGAVLGSPAYMSPEQASGGEIDARSDQFSLGALLYQLATGALPFSGTSPLVTMAKIVKGDHAPPTAKNPRVPPYLERVIERLLRPQPEGRFPSVDACVEALREGLAADGFADVDAELTAYLREPAAFNAAAERRIVDAAQAQAEAARARGETARALAAANRVLAWRPDDPRALAFTAGLASRPRRVAMIAAAGALVVAAAGAIGWRVMHAKAMAPIASIAPTTAPTTSPAPPAPIEAPLPPKPTATTTPPTESAATGETRKPPHKHAPPSGAAVVAHAATPTTTPTTMPTTTTTPPPTGAAARAGTTVAAVAAKPAPAPDAPATLAVAIAPWCDLTVDGQPRGRSPTTLSLPPGPHRLVCANPVSKQQLTRDLTLAPGEHRELREQLYATVRVRPRLTRGDAFAVDDGKPASAATDVEPGRRRVTLYRAGAEVEAAWIDVPPAGCTLVDAPRLGCDKP
ncbi:MAG TPA: serine/threonine-protein kinase [Polyangia bacterium]|nr:serine/threonine-protein kinase [Polyangia bacterium]